MKPTKPAAGQEPQERDARRRKTADIKTSTRAASLCKLVAGQRFFEGLTTRQIELLAGLAMEIQFENGQQIFHQGDPANRFYLILEGRVELELETGSHGVISVRSLGRGDHVGWSWLFSGGSFHVNARAAESTRAIFFYGTRLRQYCEDDHDLGYEIMRRMAETLIRNVVTPHKTLVVQAGAWDRPAEARPSMS